MGEVLLLTSGLYTTIQDKGRFGFSKYGVPKSGVMDQRSFLLANALLNNDENSSVLEWMLMAPRLEFSVGTFIVCTGAICDPILNGMNMKLNSPIRVNKGDVLEFKNIKNGCYGYVGIKGGFCSEVVMQSRSFYKSVTQLHVLKKGDIVPFQEENFSGSSLSSVGVEAFWEKEMFISVYPGAEYDQLSDIEKDGLSKMVFTISNTRSRMGIQLKENFINTLPPMLTSPVLPGTVQLTPSGTIVVLMRDCQTTGGYPRIVQLTQEAINCLSQKRSGDTIRFRLIDF